VLFYVFQGTYR